MNTAIILGHGPEASTLRERSDSLPPDLILFRTDLTAPTGETARLPVFQPVHAKATLQILSERNVNRIVMIGSFQLTNPSLHGGALYYRLIARMGMPGSNSDNIKRHIHEEFRSGFAFPAVKAVLPFLFVDNDVGINAKPQFLEHALQASSPIGGCTIVTIAGEIAKIFRTVGERAPGFHSCCLTPEKLQCLHQQKSVSGFFFDRNCTIVIDYDGIVGYIRSHGLTLQSFG